MAIAALAAPATASAHARLVRTEPASGAVLTSPPSRFVAVFDDTVRVGPGNAAVRNGGASVLAGTPSAHGRMLVLPLRPHLAHGAYSVRWSVISEDGHDVQGVLAFAVGAGQPVPEPTLHPAGETGVGTLLTRWLFFTGLLLAGGVAFFDLVVWRPLAHSGLPTSWIAVGLATMFVSGQGLVHASHAGTATRFGIVVEISAAASAAGATAAAIAIADRTAAPFALALALAALPVPTLAGHSLDPGRSWIDAPLDLLHVTAAAVWLGGILALALIVPRLRAPSGLAAAAARRFSRIALASVLVVGATGVGRALAELSAVSQLWTTSYGEVIVVKTALFGLLLVLGWTSRSLLASARVRYSVSAELAVLLGLVAAVALLTALPPGRQANPSSPSGRADGETVRRATEIAPAG